MAFMRLMPYLYMTYFKKKGLGKGEKKELGKITIGYLKRLLNSFQVMISLIMSEKKIDKDNLQSHIKLFVICTLFT